MGNLASAVVGFLTLLYPLAVYFSIQYIEPWHIATMLLALLFIRLITSQTSLKWNRVLLWLAISYCGLAIWNNDLITLRFYPVLISLGLFIIFFSSLFYPPPIIERFARLQHPELPEQGVIYTRKVTQIWCAFFVFNGSIAMVTAVWCSFEWWSLYNGFISYLLMGTVMGIEYLVRIRTLEHVRR
ncbi:MAG: hypothetical protein KAT04_03660 [Methylococcales bacterium]|nr:hypothetical protein [Methylococcales bacterium]